MFQQSDGAAVAMAEVWIVRRESPVGNESGMVIVSCESSGGENLRPFFIVEKCRDRATSSQSAHGIVLSQIPLDCFLVLSDLSLLIWTSTHRLISLYRLRRNASDDAALLSFLLKQSWQRECIIRDKKDYTMKVCITGLAVGASNFEGMSIFLSPATKTCPTGKKVKMTARFTDQMDECVDASELFFQM